MSKIHQLPPEVANMVAAGEIIERPSSALKEIIENAIDANANLIRIIIKNGGLDLLEIQDNGHGIHLEDLKVIANQHSTSKLNKITDLETIATMGFRGEALASIRYVARLSITTKTAEDECATKLSFKVNDREFTPAAHNIGTTVTIEDLFHNIPARKKFLKSAKTEFLSCENIIKRVAIGNPHVGFVVFHNDKQVLNIPKASDSAGIERRIRKIVGKNFIENSTFISESFEDYKLEGWICNPDYLRPQNDINYTYLNNRFLRDRILSHAIKVAYEGIIDIKFPSYIIFISTKPLNFDINVHPAKLEVKFLDPTKVHSNIVNIIKRHLQNPKLEDSNEYTSQNNSEASASKKVFSPEMFKKSSNFEKPISINLKHEFVPLTILKEQILVFKYHENLAYTNIKLFFKHYLKDCYMGDTSFNKYIMIIPEKFNGGRDELDDIEKIAEKLNNYAIEIERITLESIIIRGVPDFMSMSNNLYALIKKMSVSNEKDYKDIILNFAGDNTIFSNKFLAEWTNKFNTWLSLKYARLVKENLISVVNIDTII